MAVRQRVWQPEVPWRVFRKELPNDWCLRINERYTVPFANGYVLQITRAEHNDDGWECALERGGRIAKHPDFPYGPQLIMEESAVDALVERVADYPANR